MDEPLDFFETALSDFQKRYGKAIPDNTYPTNKFIEGIIKRKTVRRFTDQKINPALLEKLFAAAQSSPTSSMFQTWCAIVVEDKVHREEIFFSDVNRIHMGLADRTIKHGGTDKNIGAADKSNYNAVMECDLFVVWCVDLSRVNTILNDLEVKTLYSEDKAMKSQEAFSYSSYEIRSICDAVISAQTFCLSAESMGLGTMYCGSVKSIDLFDALKLPKKVLPIFGICVGYPKENLNFFPEWGRENTSNKKINYPKPRLPQHLVVHKEEYNMADINEIKKYNLLMTKFYEYCGLVKSMDWFERIIVRTQLHNASEFYMKLVNKYGFWFK